MKSVRVRTALAVSLFKDDSLPLGHAARLLRLARADFMRHATRHGIPTNNPGKSRRYATIELES